MSADPPPEALRPAPGMRSRKLQVLDFINRYFYRWGQSPSLQEIADAFDPPISRQRVHAIVEKLSDERQIEVLAGKARGIRLPDRRNELSEAEVLLLLKARGMIIPPPPPSTRLGTGLTEKELPDLPYLE